MASDSTAFSFAIPLRPRATAQDWSRVCQLLNHTLLSVLRQDDADFSVLLACHELPEIPTIADPRVTVLFSDRAHPTTFDEQMADKAQKKRICTAALKARGGGYLMFLDADDMVSRKLVCFVRTHPSKFGYVIDQGYHYDSKTGNYHRLNAFDKRCGSCAIFRFLVDDLPDDPNDPSRTISDRFGNHIEWRDIARRLGRGLEPLGFPGAVHVVETGENVSAQQPRERRRGLTATRRRLVKALYMYFTRRPVDDFFRNEFGIPWAA